MRLTTLVLLTLATPAVLAHTGPHGHELFESGLAHPFTGIDHLATWLGLGAWLGWSLGLKVFRIPVVVPSLLIGGLYWGLHAAALPDAGVLFQLGNALGTVVLLTAGGWFGRRLARRRAAT